MTADESNSRVSDSQAPAPLAPPAPRGVRTQGTIPLLIVLALQAIVGAFMSSSSINVNTGTPSELRQQLNGIVRFPQAIIERIIAARAVTPVENTADLRDRVKKRDRWSWRQS